MTDTAWLPAYRDASMTWMQFMGIPQETDFGVYQALVDYGKAPADEAWVYTCVKLIYEFAEHVPLRVNLIDGDDLIPWEKGAPDDSDMAALAYLLDNVNPVDMNGSDLRGYTAAAMPVWGENYWKKVRGRFGGPPQELYWLRAPDVDPRSANGRKIDYFEYRPGKGNPETIAFRDMVPMKTVNLQDPLHGLSALASTRYDVSTSRQGALHTSALIGNGSLPQGAWIAGGDRGTEPPLTNQEQSIIKRALRALRGPKNAGKIPILPPGLKYQQLSLTPRDAEWLAARKVSRMTVCAAFGVPLVLAGDDEKTTVYANLRDAERIFARRQMRSLDHIANTINGWLVPDFDRNWSDLRKRRIKVAWDYSDVLAELLPPDQAANIWNGWIDRNAVTRNETRRYFRLGKDLEWGDEPYVPTRVTGREDVTTPLVESEEQGDAAPEDITPPAVPANAAETIRSIGRGLYQQRAVRAFLSGERLDYDALLGSTPDEPTREAIRTGLSRRYSAAQIVDGVPTDGYAGLRGTRP